MFWACHDGAPSPVPMVSLERSYVREVLASPFCEGWGWGRIATPARIVPGGLVVGYAGRALMVSGRLVAGLENCLERLLCTSAARAAVCSSVRREHSVFPLTVITPRGPGILSLSMHNAVPH